MVGTVKKTFAVLLPGFCLSNVDEVERLKEVGDILDASKRSLLQFFVPHLGFPQRTNVINFPLTMPCAGKVDHSTRTIGAKASIALVVLAEIPS